MNPAIMKVCLSILILFIYSQDMASAGEEFLTMPKELEALAESIDCEAPVDHYENPATLEPPYLYGVLPGLEEESAAFWCRKRSADKIFMLLVLAKFERDKDFEISEMRHGQIVSYYEFNRAFAGCGLTRWNEKDVHLLFFLKMPSFKPYVGENVRTEVWPIHAKRAYESCGVYYFLRGDWYTMPLD